MKGFNLVALRAIKNVAEGPMADGRSNDFAGGVEINHAMKTWILACAVMTVM